MEKVASESKRQKDKFDIRLNLFGKEDMNLHLRPVSGKILAVLVLIMSLTYFLHLVVNLFNTNNDVYKSFKVINDLGESTSTLEPLPPHIKPKKAASKANVLDTNSVIDLGEMNFMVLYEIQNWNDAGKFGVLDSNGNFDYEKVQQYLQLHLVYERRVNSSRQVVFAEYRKCKAEDFTRNGYGSEVKLNWENLVCPEIDWLGDELQVWNAYSDKENRGSFHVEVMKCSPDLRTDCADEALIAEFLAHVYFTAYLVTERVDFRGAGNLQQRPVVTYIQYF